MKVDAILYSLSRPQMMMASYAEPLVAAFESYVLGKTPIKEDFLRNKSTLMQLGGTPLVSDWQNYDYYPQKIGNVAVIPIEGVLMKEDYCWSAGTNTMAKWFKAAESDPEVKAILGVFSSGGGEAIASSSLANTIASINKPKIAWVEDVMASGALYAAGSFDKIYASNGMCLVGSLGAMQTWTDTRLRDLMQGVIRNHVYADTSTLKHEASKAALNNDFTVMKRNLNQIDAQFMDFMKKYRPQLSETALKGLETVAADAIDNGLIDGIMTFDEALLTAKNYKKQAINNPQNTSRMSLLSIFKGIGSSLNQEIKSETDEAAGAEALTAVALKQAEWQNQLTAATTRATTAETALTNLQNDYNALKTKNDASEAELTTVKAKLAELKAKIPSGTTTQVVTDGETPPAVQTKKRGTFLADLVGSN